MTLKGAMPGGMELLSGLVSLDLELPPIHELSDESLLSWLCSRPNVVAGPACAGGRCLLRVEAAAMGRMATPLPTPVAARSGSGGGRGSTPFS